MIITVPEHYGNTSQGNRLIFLNTVFLKCDCSCCWAAHMKEVVYMKLRKRNHNLWCT